MFTGYMHLDRICGKYERVRMVVDLNRSLHHLPVNVFVDVEKRVNFKIHSLPMNLKGLPKNF